MGTKQPGQPFIDSLDRMLARYRRPDQLINILKRLNVRSDDTHLFFQISRTSLSCWQTQQTTIFITQ
jgi:hypothetical protein